MIDESSHTSSIIVGSVGLTLVAATSTPALFTIYWKYNPRKAQTYHEINGLYEDEDGAATEESQEKYSTIVPRILILTSSVVGLLVSIAASVLSTVHPGRALFVEGWITFGAWVCGPVLYDVTYQLKMLGIARSPSIERFL